MRRLALLLTVVLASVAAAAAPADAAKKRSSAKWQLTSFRSCDGLVSFADRRARRFGSEVFGVRRSIATGGLVTGPIGGPVAAREDAAAMSPGPSAQAAPVEGTDFSGTNVQEKGIDEPDAVKTDGRRLYVAMNQRLHLIDLTAEQPRLVASVPLEGYGHELLLRGDRVLVLSSGGFDMPMPIASPPRARAADLLVPYRPETTLLELDAGDLHTIRTLTVPGSVVGARLRGATARIAISTPSIQEPREGAPDVRRFVPAMELRRANDGRTMRRSIAPCSSVRHPQVFAGLGLLTVLTIDLDRGLTPVDSDAVLADASTVYASAGRMYLATERWVDPQTAVRDGAPAGRSTSIHAFGISGDDTTTYKGSGSVRGYLLNQFSLSEHKGFLRVATTEDPPWDGDLAENQGESESFVTVLDERATGLAPVGRVGGLGRGERIFAVRFAEDVGYVVTFRQVDPLYTLDLADPAAPRVVGELKIPGFSSYLHPLGEDLVLGVGQDATSEGRVRGAQVSLFDVSDLRNPRRVHQLGFGSGTNLLAEHDHHAFLWWPATKLLVLPLSDYDYEGGNRQPFAGATGLRVDRAAGFAEVGRTEHPAIDGDWRPQIVRALVAGDRVITISYGGVQTGRLDTLAGTAWIPFPQQQP